MSVSLEMAQRGDQQRALRVCHYYQNSADHDKLKTVKHFVDEGERRTTIYRILTRFEATGTSQFKSKSGRPIKIMTPQTIKKVSKIFREEPSTSVRNCAKALDLSPSTVKHIKVNKLEIRARTKQKAPKYQGDQAQRAKTSCRRFYENLNGIHKDKVIIMDDETYVPFDPSDVPGRS